MTPLEKKLAQSKWVHRYNGFSTVKDGLGFIVYQYKTQMWLVGLTKKETDERRRVQKTTDPEVVLYTDTYGRATNVMFQIPASPELLSAVVLSSHPELSL
jgi:hypothetical protein